MVTLYLLAGTASVCLFDNLLSHLNFFVFRVIYRIMTNKKVDGTLFSLFCEKQSDGTKHLRLKGNELFQRIGRRLNEDDIPILAEFLQQNSAIISLDLAYNNLGDKGVERLCKPFLHCENNLQYLNLIHCDILSGGLKWLASAQFLKLRKVWLLGNKFGAEGAMHLGGFIEKCPMLELLDISETDQTLESIESILILIEKSQLKHLNISRIIPSSYYSKYNDSILADDLRVLLKLNTSLEVIQMQKCSFDGHDMELLIGGLKAHRKLTMLDLGANVMGSHGVELLAEWLKTRPALIALRIPSNRITTPGAQALGLSLPFSRIRYLDIHDNRIGDLGLADMFDSIRKSTQMRMLFFWGNKLGDMALTKLERMLISGTLVQKNIDVRIYYVDGKRQAAFYPSDHFKHKAYSVLDYGFPPELKIVKRKIIQQNAKPRALLNFEYIDRYPPVDLDEKDTMVNREVSVSAKIDDVG